MDRSDLSELPARFFGGQDRLQGPLPPELCAADYRAEIAGFPPMDAAAHGEFGKSFYAAFSDLYHRIDEAVPADGHVTTRFTIRGKQTGPFFGIPPTGREIDVQAIVLLTVEDGKVRRLHAVFDQLGLLRQLGAAPG